MIPTYFLELADTNITKDVYKKYFDTQYPETNDCIVLDKQIADIQADIDSINKRELANQKECNCSPSIKVPCTSTSFTSGCFNGTKLSLNPDYSKSIMLRKQSKTYLQDLLSKKKNLQSLADCRNKIETVRQEETAQVFTQTSAEAEQRILPKTNQKLYVTIGIGAVVIVTSLVLYLRNKK
jgi:LPXTG-motif cell wall-anchored protein